MTELDFLPEWYQVRQQRRRSYFAFVWLGACLIGAMALWFWLTQDHISRAQADVNTALREQESVNEQLAKCDKLRVVRDEMRRKSEIAGMLVGCPDMIHVLRQLVELMPVEIALTGLEVGSEVIPDVSAQTAPSAGSGKGKKASASPSPKKLERRRYTLRITGVAPFDELVANMITRLSNSAAFANVQIVYTKDVRRSAKLMRQFELTCQLADNWEAIDAVADASAEKADGPIAAEVPAK